MNKTLLKKIFRRAIFFTLMALGISSQSVQAQIPTYTFTQSTGTYTPITGGTVIVAANDAAPGGNDSSAMDDYQYMVYDIPFSFNWGGTTVTNFRANSNGSITFGTPATTTTTPLSTTITGVGGAIAPYAADLMGLSTSSGTTTSGSNTITAVANTALCVIGAKINGAGIPTGTTITGFTANTITMSANATSTNTATFLSWCTGEIRFEALGTAPNRTFVIQFKGMSQYSTSPTDIGIGSNMNYQIRLNEAGGVAADQSVSIVYGNCIRPGASGTGQVGIRGATTSEYNNRTTTTDWSATTAGTSNSSTVTWGGGTIIPPSGLTFTWTPPVLCSGTVTAGTIGVTSQNVCTGSTPAVLTASGYSTGSGLVFAWEESNDDGNSDPWAPAVGGTGANTFSYTPPTFTGTTIYYRLTLTCTAGGATASSASSAVNPAAPPPVGATAINFTNVSYNSMTINWTNGNGGRRYVVINNVNSFTDPVNGSMPAIAVAGPTYFGVGEQIVYDGTGSSVTVGGMACNSTYYVRVYEYQRCGSGPYDHFFNVTPSANNPATQALSSTTVSLPLFNNFTGYTGANLPAAVPGWFEGKITTPVSAALAHSNPITMDGNWQSTTILGPTTARINLYTTNRNDWIISPLVNLATPSRIKFKAALTDYVSGSADPSAMQGTDDSVFVMVSADGCGNQWTPVYAFYAANTTTLSNTLTEFIVPLPTFTGQDVRIAFQGTDGPIDNGPDYDFHVTDIAVEPIPTCETPTAITASAVTATTATISWTASISNPTNGYDYYISPTNTAPTVTTPPTGSVAAGVTSVNINSGLSVQNTYYVWVRANCGGGDLSVWQPMPSFSTPPVNNECATAIDITSGATITGTTAGATQSQAACDATVTANDVWYMFTTGSTAGNVTVSVNTTTSLTDIVLSVFSGTCGTLTVLTPSTSSGSGSCVDGPAAGNEYGIYAVAANTTYYVRIYGYNGAQGTFPIQATGTPLAIKLADISATNAGPRNRVDWSTVTESAGDYFTIERSADNRTYTTLGTVNAKGTPATYSYWDQDPINGANYYRLKMNDAAGKTQYSKVVIATVKGNGGFNIEAYPNPVTDVVTIKMHGVQSAGANVTISDVTGKIIRKVIVNGNEVKLNMSYLAQGTYFIKYTDNTQSQTIKLNKQ